MFVRVGAPRKRQVLTTFFVLIFTLRKGVCFFFVGCVDCVQCVCALIVIILNIVTFVTFDFDPFLTSRLTDSDLDETRKCVC